MALIRVWIANQMPIHGEDRTPYYLDDAGVPYTMCEGYPCIPEEELEKAQRAVRQAGHGIEEYDDAFGTPRLVKRLTPSQCGFAYQDTD